LEVIARVNGDPVTRAQFNQMVGNPITLRQARHEVGVEHPDRHELERLAMRRLVHLRLLVQEAARRKLTIAERELDQTVSAISRRFESLKEFGAWINDQGLNDPLLFDTVRADMLAERATTALLGEVSLADQEAQEYFAQHREDLIIGAEVRLRIIAVRGRLEANEVVRALKKGAPFNLMARRRSVGRLAAAGGDTGWVPVQNLPTHLQAAAAELKPGDVGEPLETGKDEFLIMGVQDRRPVHASCLAEARAEIDRRLLPDRRKKALADWLQNQEQRARIEVFPAIAGLDRSQAERPQDL
jgi:parvulin-like peptidyl-prolyl isomerase